MPEQPLNITVERYIPGRLTRATIKEFLTTNNYKLIIDDSKKSCWINYDDKLIGLDMVTLINDSHRLGFQLEDFVVSVIAHEIGHYIHKCKVLDKYPYRLNDLIIDYYIPKATLKKYRDQHRYAITPLVEREILAWEEGKELLPTIPNGFKEYAQYCVGTYIDWEISNQHKVL